MGSPLTEYRKRHKLDFVWGGSTANGVCYFNKDGKPYLVCLISEPFRAVTRCAECESAHSMGKTCVELIKILEDKGADVMHEHIYPDTDLNAVAGELEGDVQPFQAKNRRELEVWLWTFFMRLKVISGSRWQQFRKSQKGGKAFQAVEQMLWMAQHCPDVFRLYYHSFYTNYLLGRNYLMYR